MKTYDVYLTRTEELAGQFEAENEDEACELALAQHAELPGFIVGLSVESVSEQK